MSSSHPFVTSASRVPRSLTTSRSRPTSWVVRAAASCTSVSTTPRAPSPSWTVRLPSLKTQARRRLRLPPLVPCSPRPPNSCVRDSAASHIVSTTRLRPYILQRLPRRKNSRRSSLPSLLLLRQSVRPFRSVGPSSHAVVSSYPSSLRARRRRRPAVVRSSPALRRRRSRGRRWRSCARRRLSVLGRRLRTSGMRRLANLRKVSKRRALSKLTSR